MQNVLYFLEELSDDDIDWMIGCGSREEISAGTALIEQGEQVDGLYIFLNGNFTVSIATVGGQDKEIAELSTGDIAGEMSFIDSRPPSATVKSTSNSLVLSIPRKELAAKLQMDVAFSSRFYRSLVLLLSSRLRGTVSQLGDNTIHMGTGASDDLFVAKARFDWMVRRLRGS
jgi:CRP/FNR family transcriptional regulator, cyclic AMP receptor protein